MKKPLVLTTLLAPLTAIAAMTEGPDVCERLIPDIMANYNVEKLVQQPAGNPQVSQSLVHCIYSAIVPELWNDAPIMITVLLNTDNGRYELKMR